MEYNRFEEVLVSRGYVVSEEGQAYNKNGDKVGSTCKKGYQMICIKIGKRNKNVRVHRLQAYQKYGGKIYDEGMMIRHLDGDPSNNSWDNIEIGTASDNMMDIPEQIRIKRAKHAASVFKKYDNDAIKDFHKKDRSYKKTMEEFGISSKGTLNYILNH